MRLASLVVLLPLAAFLSSCGGGGGNDDPPSSRISLSIDSSRATNGGLTGTSIRVRVLDPSGAQTSGQVVDTTGTIQNFRLESASEARVVAELYSGASGSGTLVGTVETVVKPGAQVALSVGEPVVGVRVTPENASVTVGGGRPFYAAGVGASGALTFTQQGSFAYEAQGGAFTSTATGLVAGTTAGTGTLRALHTPSGIAGTTSVTVSPVNVTRTKWTVMVFLNAANDDISAFAALNMNQMERVAGNKDVRFVVQWKYSQALLPSAAFDGTRRYLVKSDTSSAVVSDVVQDLGQGVDGLGVDMGSAETMADFVNWSKANYPAERYALVVWNHGNGWRRSRKGNVGRGVSYDDQRGTSIKTHEFAQMIPGEPLDILSWDSSLMQMAEVAYEVRGRAKFVVGSEESPPGEGLPYDLVFKRFRDNPDASTRDLSRAFVDGMLEYKPYEDRAEKITQSVIDTSKMSALASAIDNLAGTLITNRTETAALIPQIRATAQRYSDDFLLDGGMRIYRDLIDVCTRLEAGTANPQIIAASQAVRAAASEAIVWEGHNAFSPGSRGISIDFTAGDRLRGSALPDYRLTQFGIDTRWDEFLAETP